MEWSKWNLDDIELLLKQSACHCLGLVTSKMLGKSEGVSDLDVWNKIAGVEIKRAGISHSLLYTYSSLKAVVDQNKNDKNKAIVYALCLLFGVHSVLNHANAIAEGGFLVPDHITSLLRLKEKLLEQIRPELVGILDSFMMPEHLVRSAFASGNPYEVLPSLNLELPLAGQKERAEQQRVQCCLYCKRQHPESNKNAPVQVMSDLHIIIMPRSFIPSNPP